MSEVNEVEKLFKAVKPFPNDVELASLSQHCMVIVSDLQRQLAEAREEIDIQKGHLELAISLSDDPNIKLLCTALLEQLKERGNE